MLDAMLPYMTAFYGNPHSRTHAYGWESEKAVEEARAVRRASPRRPTPAPAPALTLPTLACTGRIA